MTDSTSQGADVGQRANKRVGGVMAPAGFSWALFEFARNPFYMLIVTYVFPPYFQSIVIGDAVKGQAAVADATGIAGVIAAGDGAFPDDRAIFLVEGEFKALSLLETGVWAIGIPSFTVYSKDEDGDRQLLRDLQITLGKEKPAVIYYLGDADTCTNFEFARNASFIASAASPSRVVLPRIPIDQPKGIDDCEEALAELRRLRFLKFDQIPLKKDLKLKKLVSTEGPGILNLILRLIPDLLSLDHISQGGPGSEASSERFKIANDPVGTFVATDACWTENHRKIKTD